jgi:hypothetical protein
MRSRGIGKVANGRNLSQTVVIDVLFSYNLAAILDTYISFFAHPS